MPKLYVVRHAEPATKGVLLGHTDPPLSETGRASAIEKMRGLDVVRVWSSPLRRCVETARSIDAPISIHEDLREISLGEWDGLSWAEIEARYPDHARRKVEDWTAVTPPGGEAWDAFSQRVRSALREIVRAELPAAVVGHVAVNSVIAESLSGIDALAFVQGYCEILGIEINRGNDEGK